MAVLAGPAACVVVVGGCLGVRLSLGGLGQVENGLKVPGLVVVAGFDFSRVNGLRYNLWLALVGVLTHDGYNGGLA